MDKEILEKGYKKWLESKPHYDKMYKYFKGITDIDSNYKFQTERSNLKVKCNFIKKFIREETSYNLGNDITYVSKSGNAAAVNQIDLTYENLSEQHDIELSDTLGIFNQVYEVYYIEDKEFKAMVVGPHEGFFIEELGKKIAFVRRIVFDETKEDEYFLEVYTDKEIFTFDKDYNLKNTESHKFGFIPVGSGTVGKEGRYNSLFNDLKGLQDAYENNLSDLVNEISDFRNAYMVMKGGRIQEGEEDKLKAKGILQNDNENFDVHWLIKQLDDSFIQNTLQTLEDKMYQLSQHINHNERMQSNLSGVALRSRLISLEEKCKLNQRALTDVLKTRLKALFIYINGYLNTNYDWRDIKIKFTPNIPQDDLVTAQMLSQLPQGTVSKETGRSLFSFIENPIVEGEKVKKETEEELNNFSDLNIGVDVVE